MRDLWQEKLVAIHTSRGWRLPRIDEGVFKRGKSLQKEIDEHYGPH